jgi:hypothetical protein
VTTLSASWGARSLEELRRRVAQLRDQVSRWRADGQYREAIVGVQPSQRVVLELLVDSLLTRCDGSLADLAPALPLAQFSEGYARALSVVVDAESLWATVNHLVDQRRDPRLRPYLENADLIAADCYRSCFERARAWNIVDGDAIREPPLVYLDVGESAATIARNVRPKGGSGPGGYRARRLPIPIVMFPVGQFDCPWSYCALYHEIGHDLDQDFGLRVELAELITTKVAVERSDEWKRWTGEIVADAVGVLLGGIDFVVSLAPLLAFAGGNRVSLEDEHPPAPLRMRLLSAMLRARGPQFDVAAGELESVPLAGADAMRTFEEESAVVAEAVLRGRLRALRGRCLSELAASAADDEAATTTLSQYLVSPEVTPKSPDAIAARLIPAAAQRALGLVGAITQDSLERVHARAMDYASRLPRPQWTLSKPRTDFLRILAESVEPPHLDPMVYGKKIPPIDLLTSHQRLAFVGATNHRLANALREGLKRRREQRWPSIEVFFLAPEAVRQLEHPGRSADELVELRQKAEAELRGFLPSCADAWALYEHASPLYFASYWDWDAPGGRIHVSPGVWGYDIAHAPGIDYLRVAEPPPEAYRVYMLGLASLTKLARVLAQS